MIFLIYITNTSNPYKEKLNWINMGNISLELRVGNYIKVFAEGTIDIGGEIVYFKN